MAAANDFLFAVAGRASLSGILGSCSPASGSLARHLGHGKLGWTVPLDFGMSDALGLQLHRQQSWGKSAVGSTIKVALFKTGQAVAAGFISPEVVVMTKGVLEAMVLTKLRIATVVVAMGIIGIGTVVLICAAQAKVTSFAEEAITQNGIPVPPALLLTKSDVGMLVESVLWELTGVDTQKNTISGRAVRNRIWGSRRIVAEGVIEWPSRFQDLLVAKDAEVRIDGREGKLSDLKVPNGEACSFVTLRLAKDNGSIQRIDARSENGHFILHGMDAQKSTIDLRIGVEEKPVLRDLPIAKDGRILIDRNGWQEAKVSDLVPGMRILFELATEDGQIMLKEIMAKTGRD